MRSGPPVTAQTSLGKSGKKQAKQQQQQRPCINYCILSFLRWKTFKFIFCYNFQIAKHTVRKNHIKYCLLLETIQIAKIGLQTKRFPCQPHRWKRCDTRKKMIYNWRILISGFWGWIINISHYLNGVGTLSFNCLFWKMIKLWRFWSDFYYFSLLVLIKITLK